MTERTRTGNPSFRTRAIATRVRELRKQRHITGQQLSDAVTEKHNVDFSRATLANLENDRRDNVTVDELYALAAVLDTTVEYLAGGLGHACSNCFDEPPAGFTCTICGRTS